MPSGASSLSTLSSAKSMRSYEGMAQGVDPTCGRAATQPTPAVPTHPPQVPTMHGASLVQPHIPPHPSETLQALVSQVGTQESVAAASRCATDASPAPASSRLPEVPQAAPDINTNPSTPNVRRVPVSTGDTELFVAPAW